MGDTAVVPAAALPYVAGRVVHRIRNFVVDRYGSIVNFLWFYYVVIDLPMSSSYSLLSFL